MDRLEKWKNAILGWLRAHPRITVCLSVPLLLALIPLALIWDCLKGAWEGLRDSWEVEREGIRELWACIRRALEPAKDDKQGKSNADA